ncbi:hypothetical protein Bca101_015213 [Brassica carinata]
MPFLCRSPFTVCNTAFLGEGVSEEQHRRAIRELAEEQTFNCAKRVLEMLFTDEQLLVIYRLSFEIDLALSDEPAFGDAIVPQNNRFTLLDDGDPGMDYEMTHRVAPLNDSRAFSGQTNDPPVIHAVPLNTVSPDHSSNIFRGASVGMERADAEINLSDEEDNWESLYDGYHAVPPPLSPPLRPTEGVLGPIVKNANVTPQPSNPENAILGADAAGSFTASSDETIVKNAGKGSGVVIAQTSTEEGESSRIQTASKIPPMSSSGPPIPIEVVDVEEEPSLDLTLGFGKENNNATEGAYVVIDDSSSEVGGDIGGCGNSI